MGERMIRSTRGLSWQLMLPVFVIVSLDAMSMAAVLPVLPFYLRDMGATPLMLGLVFGAEGLSQFVAAPWLGQLSDRYGRKKVLLASQAGALASLLLLASANVVVLVLVARVLFGLTAGNFSAAAAYAADHSTTDNRRQAIGLLSAGLGLGGMVGPTLAGLVAEVSLVLPILVAFGLSAVSITVTTFWLKGGRGAATEGPAPQRMSFRTLLGTPGIRVLVVVLLCHFFSYGVFNSQLAVFLSDTFSWLGHAFGPTELGYLLTADGAINIVVQLFLLRWLGRVFTERNLIVLIFAVLSAGYLVAVLANGIPMLALAVLCVSAGVALARPTFVAALSVRVRRNGRAWSWAPPSHWWPRPTSSRRCWRA
jgi:DHA1 family tetracycline resistance protein-like MFS transporter